jgi:hypothetical protein
MNVRVITFALSVFALACSIGQGSARCNELKVAVKQDGHPQIIYTDIQSGPTTGGENDRGIYLSIFGQGFGRASDLGVTTKVYIGSHEVYSYRYLGPSHGRPDIQEITVQVGSLGNASPGLPLPIEVRAGSEASNTNVTFTPNPGNIYFVDNVTGNDASGVPGDIAHPYRFVQTPTLTSGGVWPHIGPGDFIVMRGHGLPWTDIGYQGYFLRFANTPGSAPTGNASSGPVTLMGYPAEDVFIDETYSISHQGAIAGVNGGVLHNCGIGKNRICGEWVTIADLRIEGGGHDGPVNLEIAGDHWRVINNILTARTGSASARAGGVTGDGTDVVILGNEIADVDSPDKGLQNHGIYIDGLGSYRVEYNFIHNIPGGSGIQIYSDETPNGDYRVNDVVLSHNWISDVAKYCINLADHSGSGFKVFANVSSSCGMAGIRINSSELHDARIFNNTFFEGNTRRDSHYGVITIDSSLQANAITFINNIFVPASSTPYMGGDEPILNQSRSAVFSDNLYFGGLGNPVFDSHPILQDPLFVDAHRGDFHLQPGSGAILSGSSAVNGVVNSGYDLGVFLTEKQHDVGAYSFNLNIESPMNVCSGRVARDCKQRKQDGIRNSQYR